MNSEQNRRSTANELFDRAACYDLGINWSARLKREIPVLTDVLGPPAAGGLLDAGCGTGHQICALAQNGYRAVGADLSEEMIGIARRAAMNLGVSAEFHVTPYATLHHTVGGGFDGLFCLGNALAAAGSADAVRDAIGQFASCLRSGGRLFIQIVNFPLMRRDNPCVRGPRVARVGDVEYVSMRHFVFGDEQVEITNITLWKDSGWKHRAHTGTLYPATVDQLRDWCEASELRVDDVWGGYDRAPFDPQRSTDLLISATKA
jgi:SAM-dependent methyltransferase